MKKKDNMPELNRHHKKLLNLMKKVAREYGKLNYKDAKALEISIYPKDGSITQLNIRSVQNDNRLRRQELAQVVMHLDCQRDEWSTIYVVAFLHWMELLTYEEEIPEEILDDISHKFNISKKAITNTANRFIDNFIFHDIDKYGISEYFSIDELLQIRYHDIDKLQEDIEKNKLNEYHLDILHEMDKIV